MNHKHQTLNRIPITSSKKNRYSYPALAQDAGDAANLVHVLYTFNPEASPKPCLRFTVYGFEFRV